MEPEHLSQFRSALANRYAIGEEVGRGGMATVYLAHDLKHGRRVAIKVLDPELTATIGADRFLREIEIASKLTHPNILPLHDSGEVEGFLYYVMPYIEGQSLRKRILRSGGLPLSEALHIARGVAAALDHAHRHGVVHRDIKPDNILLADDVPVVADFGIARAFNAASGDYITRAGAPLGTPLYMSPEQALGSASIDARSDIYSLALVIYEMLMGDVPNTPAERRSIETDTPSGNRRRWAALPRSVTRALSRAMSEDPTRRFETAGAFASALTTRVAFPRALGRRRAGIVLVAASIGLSIVGLALGRARVRERSDLMANRVFVTPFANDTGDSTLAPLGAIVVDWLTRGLQETGLTQVVDARVVASEARMAIEAALAAARRVRAGTVISGAYYALSGDSLQFQAHLTEAATGTVVHSLEPVRVSRAAPLEAVDLLRQRVAGAMASILDQNWPTAFMKPPTYEAYQEYITAVPLVGRLDYAGAVRHFLTAAAYDTSFALPRIYAATLLNEGGMFATADSLAHEVARNRLRLPTLERNLLDYLEARLAGNDADALAAMRRVADAAPMSEASMEVGQLLLRLNEPRGAGRLLAGLDPTRGFLQDWWFYWNQFAATRHMMGDHEEELAIARRGLEQHPLEIGVLAAEIYALAALGNVEELNGRLDEAEQLAPQFADRPVPPMWQLTEAARELRAHRHEEAARVVFERIAAWGANRTESVSPLHRPHMVVVAYLSGRWNDAQRRFAELSAASPGDVNFRGYLGVLAARRGDVRAARRTMTQLEMIDRPYQYGIPTVWRARIAALLGDRNDALALLRQAFDEGLAHYGTPPFLWIARTDLAWLHRDVDLVSLHGDPDFNALLGPRG